MTKEEALHDQRECLLEDIERGIDRLRYSLPVEEDTFDAGYQSCAEQALDFVRGLMAPDSDA